MSKILITYFSRIKNIPDDYIGLVISRFPPKWLDIRNNPKLYYIEELSPYEEILLDYKRTNDWDEFKDRFNIQMELDEDFNKAIFNLVKAINWKGKKYCLICYEKDYNHCHRKLVAEYIRINFGIEWEEMEV